MQHGTFGTVPECVVLVAGVDSHLPASPSHRDCISPRKLNCRISRIVRRANLLSIRIAFFASAWDQLLAS